MTKDDTIHPVTVIAKSECNTKNDPLLWPSRHLKPSKVADNGYRLYTDADFAKLQKSVIKIPRIFFGRDHDDDDQRWRSGFIKESIGLQLYLVQKDGTLKTGRAILRRDGTKMDNEEEIDWTQMMNLLHVTNLEKDCEII